MTRNSTVLSCSLIATTLACSGAQPPAPDSSTPPDLAGRWRSSCLDPGSGQAIRLSFDLTPATWSLEYEVFAESSCAQPILSVHIDGPYVLTGPSASVAGAFEGTFEFAHKTVTPLADGAVGYLMQACGGGAYQVGVASDISAGCMGLGTYPIASCPADYDLVARNGDELRFGQRPSDNNMCTPDKRPEALSGVVLAHQL